MYVVTSGELYVKFDNYGKMTTTDDIEQALKIKTEHKASNVLTGLPRRIRKLSSKWSILLIEDNLKDEDNQDIIISNEISLHTIGELMEDFAPVAMLITEMQRHKSDYMMMLNQCDMETNDLLHRLELKGFNACEGYKLAKQLSEVRKKRREMKDVIEFLTDVDDFGSIYKIEEKLKEMRNKHYNPRILCELFE